MNHLKLTFFLGLLLFAGTGNLFSQQVLNGGFEETDEINFETYWYIGLMYACYEPPFPVLASIVHDSHSGDNAMKLTPDICNPQYNIPPGNIATNDYAENGPGFGNEYHERPENLNFYYKYFPENSGEVAFVKIMLFDYDSSTYEVTEVIGEASANISEQSEYTLFTLPIEYYTESIPEYIHILFSTSENFSYWENIPLYNPDTDNVNSLGTELYLDDVYVSGGTVGTRDYPLDSHIKLYPNPLSDILTIQNDGLDIHSVKIYNVLGELIMEEKNHFTEIPVTNIDKGLYFVEVVTGRGVLTKKVLKK